MIMLLLKIFFKTLKSELLSKDAFKTRREAKTKVFEYIEVYYNKRRIHSTLNWCSPKEYLENYYKKTGKREGNMHHREQRKAVMLWPSGGICLKYQTAADTLPPYHILSQRICGSLLSHYAMMGKLLGIQANIRWYKCMQDKI